LVRQEFVGGIGSSGMCVYYGETGSLLFSRARFRPAGSRSPQTERFFRQIDLASDNTNSNYGNRDKNGQHGNRNVLLQSIRYEAGNQLS
jgi:hypothetical protein